MRTQNRLFGLILFLLSLTCYRLVPLEPQNSPPRIPNNIFPVNDTTDIPVNIKFIWSGGDPDKNDSVVYDFYLKANKPEPELVASGINDTSFHYRSLSFNTRYHWKIVARDPAGESSTSPTWTFSTRYENNAPPNVPNSPHPESGITFLSIENTTLSWSGGDPDSFSIVTYDVYFGKKNEPISLILESQSDTLCTVGVLEFDTKYLWKVVAKDHYGLIAEGPVWNFSVEPAQLIFEDTFDTSPTHGYPDPKIWTHNKSGANLFITDSLAWNNQGKSVCFIDSTKTGNCFLGTRFPAKLVGMLGFCWRITTRKDVFGVRLYSRQSDPEQLGPQLSVREGRLQYYDCNYNWQTICDIDTNSWYFIQLFFDCSQNYYKIFVNEELEVDHATWTGSAVTNLDIIYFMTFDNRICYGAYLDEIRFYAGSSPRPK